MDMWDDEACFELAACELRLARASGTLSWLPFTLDYLAEIHVQAGELSKAAALLMERGRASRPDQLLCPTSRCCCGACGMYWARPDWPRR